MYADFNPDSYRPLEKNEGLIEYTRKLTKLVHPQIRLTGRPYYEHPFEVAKIVGDILQGKKNKNLGEICALGHDFLEAGMTLDQFLRLYKVSGEKAILAGDIISTLSNDKTSKYKIYVQNMDRVSFQTHFESIVQTQYDVRRIFPLIVKLIDGHTNTNPDEKVNKKVAKKLFEEKKDELDEREFENFIREKLKEQVKKEDNISDFTSEIFVEKSKKRLESMLFRNSTDHFSWMINYFETRLLEEPGLDSNGKNFSRDKAIEETQKYYSYEKVENIFKQLCFNSFEIAKRNHREGDVSYLINAGDLRGNKFLSGYETFILKVYEEYFA